MRNPRHDDLDDSRAPSMIEQTSTDLDEKRRAAGAGDDLEFLMAMLALAEGAGPERRLSMAEQKTHAVPGSRHAEKPEALERPVEIFEEDLVDSVHEKAKSSARDERAVAKAVIALESSD